MSGHSKWHKIRQKKGATDAARAKVFTKLAKAVTIAARDGGGDPGMNFKLRMAIDKAKAGNLPKDKIDAAITRGTGEGSGLVLEEVVYEAYGPGGVGMLIECLTDNTNRAVSEVKHILSKNGSSLAGQGSVMWMFDRKAVFRFGDPLKIGDRDAFELCVIDAGAEDIQEEDGELMVLADQSDFQKVSEAITGCGADPDSSELEYLPKEPVEIDESASEKLQKIYEALDENDDVGNIYTADK
ncbi:MAG: YebC/PmpR family DNA-binding transcriptional regulator [Candidatus Uhrbacteria bacterium]|nr:YebC/PmpR family DNA-binding transcriptional regulator [Patescibacteria group bacterium]MBU1907147.1 YebC/PmpR family DNA-binding transcriptional regulator [Patescibacteria group bacterium]